MFYIIEQGARIQTPIDSLLKQKNIAAVSALSASRKVGPKVDDYNVLYDSQQKAHQYEQGEAGSTHERSKIIYAHQLMSSPVVTATMGQTLTEIWSLFAKQGFHHLPVLDDQQHIQGIVSDRDILRFAANSSRQVGDTPIERLMSRQVISAGDEAEVRAIAEVMCSREIGAVPIIDSSEQLVGIVSRSDILRTLVNRAPLELWA
ncbi:MAG: CBS domain-containing protein [Spongiibacteraceae bacterium]